MTEKTQFADEWFFRKHPHRKACIRRPVLQQHRDKQRAVRWLDECELQYRSLGEHDRDRRRMLIWRVPSEHPSYDPAAPKLLKLPILLNPGEKEIEDSDETLLPIIDDIMRKALGNP